MDATPLAQSLWGTSSFSFGILERSRCECGGGKSSDKEGLVRDLGGWGVGGWLAKFVLTHLRCCTTLSSPPLGALAGGN